MLSIIICHRNNSLLDAIKKSIESTVGITYELIVIDNTNNEYTIFSAYNEGVKKSKYDVVCFTHEDVLFYSNNWGEKVMAHFKDPQVGMIGVIGGMAQSAVPSAWWFNNYFGKSARNMLVKGKDKKLYHYYSNPYNEKDKTGVVIIDGMWFCIRKKLFKKISFDEKTYSGFHLYDADISLQVLQHAKNYVVYDILIEHKWSGNISKDYYEELCRFSTKWQNYLPIQNEKINNGYMKKYNWHALRSLILEMKDRNISEDHIRNALEKYYPVAKKTNSLWFRNYFFMSRFLGYANTNSLFYRIEKLVGFCKTPDYSKTVYMKTK